MAGKINAKRNKGNLRIKVIIAVCVLILLFIPYAIFFLRNSDKTGLASYKGESYTFFYPKNWTMKKTDRSDINGTEFFLQPPHAAPPETPYVLIDEASATQTAESKLTDPFIIFKYKRTDATVNGISTQKYTNVVHAAEGVFHSTAYVFETKGHVYLITVGYKQEVPDTELENEFSQIVSNFTPR